ncbi:MAG: hypothetical protein HPY82_05955 [Gammaproteobacteria bacterium]|nr:hypothetical protein [Gammaproteobacteria bacterium]
MTFSNPFCHQSDRNNPKKPAYHAGESNAVYLRSQNIRSTMKTEISASDLANKVKELEAKLARLTKAASAMRQDIISRIEPDDDGFQPYDGNLVVWNEFCQAMEAAKG